MTRSLISTTGAILLAILFAANIKAQSGASLAGLIADENGDVIINADVTLLSIASGRIFKTKTDSSGKYQLTDLPLGSYQFSVSSEGFATATRSIALHRIGGYTEDFVLVPGVIESSVTVTAAKGNLRSVAQAPQTITVSDAPQIEERRPSSTSDAFAKAPNLTPVAANPALVRPRLRGLASNRILIIIDGDRLNNARSDPTSGVSPSVIDVTQLDSVEVVSGAGSSLYGTDAMAGIINLLTPGPVKSDRPHYLGLRMNGDLHTNGIFRRGATVFNWSEPKFALRLGGSLFREGDYHAGGGSLPLGEVVRLGKLTTDMGNMIGNSVARTYAIWSLPANAEIPNNQGHGFNDQLDFWFFPGVNQSFRYRQLNSQHQNLGFSFIAPPFDQRTQFNSFRRLDKYGLSYEVRELSQRVPRVALSAYRQKYSFPDDTLTSPIMQGSSFTFVPDPNAPQNLLAVLTGNRSTFTNANLSENKNSITTYAFDAHGTFAPSVAILFTTGVGYLRDASADEFSRTDFTAPFNVVTGRASNPNVTYKNWGWFNLIEYEASRWLRLTAGLRVDQWKTEARPTPGFPLGVEATLLDVSFAKLSANPGPIDTAGAAGILDLIKGLNNIKTNRTVVTGNVGIVVRLRHGINPYFRWGNSYREPGITERYLLRDFGDPTFSVLVIPNTTLKPERGRSYDAGVKVQRAKWDAQAGYFLNDFSDFISSAFAPPQFVPPDPSHGLNPISPFFPFHGVLYVQRTNTARARIRGFEASYEASLPLGHAGTITPLGTLGWLKGSNLTPDQNTLKLIAQFYNRSDTAVRLRGSTKDPPLSSITPFRMIQGVRFDSPKRRWFGEYEVRYQARVSRADPLDLTATISTQYGTLASLNSFVTQAVRGGYKRTRENYRASFTVGVENLANRLYFEQFQTAPAPGRSLVFGTTIELFNLLRK
jgi:outer membrane receptor protein involved in Fe transport